MASGHMKSGPGTLPDRLIRAYCEITGCDPEEVRRRIQKSTRTSARVQRDLWEAFEKLSTESSRRVLIQLCSLLAGIRAAGDTHRNQLREVKHMAARKEYEKLLSLTYSMEVNSKMMLEHAQDLAKIWRPLRDAIRKLRRLRPKKTKKNS